MPLDGSRAGTAAARDPLVKSAARALEILEFFDHEPAPATARKVAAGLGYPQSSTSALLHSLVSSGHLRFDPRSRTYLPSLRVALMGAGWLTPPLHGDILPLRLDREVAARTGRGTGLLVRNGDQAETILSLPPALPGSPPLPPRRRQAVTAPGPGRALLVDLDDADIRQLLHRLNACGGHVVRAADLLAGLDSLRRQGWAAHAEAGDAIVQLAMPLRLPGSTEPLALVVALPPNATAADITGTAAAMRAGAAAP